MYDEVCLWYLPPDVVGFARHLGFGMEAPLGSHANVLECLELLTSRAVDHHPGRTGCGVDFLYYDPLRIQKVDVNTAPSRCAATQVMPEDVGYGRVYVENDVDRAQRDASFE